MSLSFVVFSQLGETRRRRHCHEKEEDEILKKKISFRAYKKILFLKIIPRNLQYTKCVTIATTTCMTFAAKHATNTRTTTKTHSQLETCNISA
jgi:hypothetical protein